MSGTKHESTRLSHQYSTNSLIDWVQHILTAACKFGALIFHLWRRWTTNLEFSNAVVVVIQCPRWGKLEKPGHKEVDQESQEPPVVKIFFCLSRCNSRNWLVRSSHIVQTWQRWTTVLNVATVARGRSHTLRTSTSLTWCRVLKFSKLLF